MNGPAARKTGDALRRARDAAAAAAGLVVLSPLLMVIGIMVRKRLGSPVLFRQIRPGLRGRPFEMLKFRTMLDAAGPDGRPLPDEQRITRFGRFLRSTSLDELPELWNVFKGEMSLVGPRPLRMEYLPLYTPEQARRHDVRPGVTGWAQVSGRNALTWEERFRLDVWYVDHRSLWLDLKILMLTLVQVVRRQDVSPAGRETMDWFRGSNAGAGTPTGNSGATGPAAGTVTDAVTAGSQC